MNVLVVSQEILPIQLNLIEFGRNLQSIHNPFSGLWQFEYRIDGNSKFIGIAECEECRKLK